MGDGDGISEEPWYKRRGALVALFLLLLLLLITGWALYLFSGCDDSDDAAAPPPIVHDGGDTGPNDDGQIPAITSVADARAWWEESAGRPYLLQADWNTEGLFGIYCSFGVVGDPAATQDAAQALADTGSDECVRFEDSFVEPSGVEALFDAAESSIAFGGSAVFNEFGVPTFITDGADNQIRLVRFTFDPQE